MMKKTFEIKGVDLTSLYGVGDKNILVLEKQLPLQLNVRGNNISVSYTHLTLPTN